MLLWVGLVPALAAARPGRARRSARSAPSTPPSPGSPAATPTQGVFTYPERLGHWPAALGPLRVRVDGAGLPVLDRARPGAAVVRGLRRGDAARRRPVRQHASTSAPTRSRSTPRWSASCRSGAARGRAAGGPQPAGQPRRHAGPARAGRRRVACSSAARPSTRSRTPRRWVQFIQGTRPASHAGRHAVNNLALLGFCSASALVFTARHDAHRRRAGPAAGARCRRCSRTRSCRSSSATSSPTT